MWTIGGAVALESLFLTVDPVAQRLVMVDGFAAAVPAALSGFLTAKLIARHPANGVSS